MEVGAGSVPPGRRLSAAPHLLTARAVRPQACRPVALTSHKLTPHAHLSETQNNARKLSRKSRSVPARSFPDENFPRFDLSFVEPSAMKEKEKKNTKPLSRLCAAEVGQEVNMSAWGLDCWSSFK